MNCGRVSGALFLFFAVVIAMAQNAAKESAANGGMPVADPEVLRAASGHPVEETRLEDFAMFRSMPARKMVAMTSTR